MGNSLQTCKNKRARTGKSVFQKKHSMANRYSKNSSRRVSVSAGIIAFHERSQRGNSFSFSFRRAACFTDLLQEANFYYFMRDFIVQMCNNRGNFSPKDDKTDFDQNSTCNPQESVVRKDLQAQEMKCARDVDFQESDCDSSVWCSDSTEHDIADVGSKCNKHTQADDVVLQANQTLALNYLNFYMEASEFLILPHSKFRAVRAEAIAETYIRHGAPLKLHFSRLTLEEIQKKFDARPENPPSDTFDGGCIEAVEFLEAEVWSLLKEKDLLKRYQESPPPNVGRARVFKTAQPDSNFVSFQKVLRESDICFSLKNFLRSCYPQDETSLLFYLEVVDFEAMTVATELQKSKEDEMNSEGSHRQSKKKNNSRSHYLMLWGAKLYDKYAKLGAKHEMPIDNFMRNEIRNALSRSLFSKAFVNAKVFAARVLFENYQEFLSSPFYKDLEELRKAQAERKKMKLKATVLTMIALKLLCTNKKGCEPPKRQSSHSRPSGTANLISMTSFTSQDCLPHAQESVVLSTCERESVLSEECTPRPELQRMMNLNSRRLQVYGQYFHAMKKANKLYYFHKHLKTIKLNHYLSFYTDVEEYEQIPMTKKAFMKGRAAKIYDKYLRLSGVRDIVIEEHVRSAILLKLPDPNRNIFSVVKEKAYIVLIDEWPLFMQSEIYQEAIACGRIDEPTTSPTPPKKLPPEEEIPLFVLLEDQTMANLFKEFCDLEFYPQTVRFWLDVEEFKRTPSGAFLETRCNKIIQMYIKEGARCSLPISDETREIVEKNQNTPGPNLFEPAQKEVYDFMVSQLLSKFKKTDAYQDHLEHIKHLKKSPSAAIKLPSPSPTPHSVSAKMFLKEHGRRVEEDGKKKVEEDGKKNLVKVLKTKSGIRFFKEFCEQIYCTESIFFWMEAEDFLNIPGGERYLESSARKIVRKYIAQNARMQVNIPGRMRTEIIQRLDSPTRDMFVAAQTEVLEMVFKDTWPKFKASNHYQEYIHYQKMYCTSYG